MNVTGKTQDADYKRITSADPDLEPTSELRGTWQVRAPYVIERQPYRRVRGVDVDLIKSGVYYKYRGRSVVGDVLVAKGKRVMEYAPGEIAAELLTSLLDLAQGRLTPTAFADRFGSMGYNHLVPNMHRAKGEPVHWLLAHAHTLLVAFKLIDLINQARRSDAGRKKLEEYIRGELPWGPYVHRGWIFEVPALRGSAGSPVMAANNVLRHLLNPNIDHVGRHLIPDQAELKSVFLFQAPIQVAYWYLAGLIGKQTLRRCRECGRVFMHERGVKFCLAVPPKTISPCKSRFNVRKLRARVKKEGHRRNK
jgi:hypothetical protein